LASMNVRRDVNIQSKERMTHLDLSQSYIQTHIVDFINESDPYLRIQEEVNKKLKLTIQWHLEELVRLYLKPKKNPPSVETFFAYISEALPKMEGKRICYLKKMPDSSTHMFKRIFCYESDEAWRSCPQIRCPIVFPCWQECPYVKHNADLEYES